MEIKNKHIILKVWTNICRFLLGAVFVFSGFVKAIDPLGSFYKIQDYLTAFGMAEWFPSFIILLFGILLAMLEFTIGVFICLGIRKVSSTTAAFLLMLLMTPLTLYLAIENPVSDCGCFGDALVLTNWQTFGKNLFLLLAAFTLFRWRELMPRLLTAKIEWVFSMYTFFFVLILSFYCLNNLPILDFRPYKVGTDIRQGMEIPEGAEPSVYETRFVLEKEGTRKEFALENYPDSTWTFIEARTVQKTKGYEPPIQNFSMLTVKGGEDITEKVLADTSYTFLLVAPRIEEADDSYMDLINELYDYTQEHDYAFYALTSSPEEEIELWCDKTGAEYPFCQMDDITLKTIIRSNPGLILIKQGVILHKWSDNNIPDEYALTAPLKQLDLGKQLFVNHLQTIVYVLLWFFIPLLVVLGLDNAVIKRRERKRKMNSEKTTEENEK